MIAYELLAHLRYLTLAGYEDGEYVWIGNRKDWERMSDEVFAFEFEIMGV